MSSDAIRGKGFRQRGYIAGLLLKTGLDSGTSDNAALHWSGARRVSAGSREEQVVKLLERIRVA